MVTVMRHERVVHYRHGELVDVLAPGRHRFWTTGHTFQHVDMRVQLFEVRPQEIPTADGLTVKISASAQLVVVDPVAHLEHAADPHGLVYDAIKAWLREIVHQHTLEELLAGVTIGDTPMAIVATAASTGFKLTDLAIRDVLAPAEIRRAAEQLVTARQQALVALERTRGEVAVLRAQANSAKILEEHPALAAIRLAETAGSHGGTVVIERPHTP